MKFIVTSGNKGGLRCLLLVSAIGSCLSIKSAECLICPANDFYLPATEVPRMEFAALHDGNREAAVRLGNYYGIYLNKPLLGSLWNFRAAQLGDVSAAYKLCIEGLVDKKSQIFSPVHSNKKDFKLLSEIAQMYVFFHDTSNRLEDIHLSYGKRIAIRQLDTKLASVVNGCVESAFQKGGTTFSWVIDYVAYKVRWGDEESLNKDPVEILVFPSFGKMCQSAVDLAETKRLPLIVVAIDLEDRFGLRPKEVPQKECCRCVCKILERVISDYSLSSDTVIRFAEDTVFSEQMKAEGRAFTIKPAASCFMRRQ
ncbi:hypothetical protein IKQ19_18330 [Candidatus Saccharibacteria bacterium]|nr:hypothetical protein [Candidatus Saccharibacteria bacterium]